MKLIFMILGMSLSTQAWASAWVVREVNCSSLQGGASDQVQIKRVESEDDSYFAATYTAPDAKTSHLFCLASSANLPNVMRCQGLDDKGQDILLEVSSADGVLNMGGLTVNGVTKQMHCFLSWNH